MFIMLRSWFPVETTEADLAHLHIQYHLKVDYYQIRTQLLEDAQGEQPLAHAATGDRRTPWRRSPIPRMDLSAGVLAVGVHQKLWSSARVEPEMCVGGLWPRLWRTGGRFALRQR